MTTKIYTIERPALIVVDVQNDFCPGGSLAVPHGNEVVEPLNGVMAHFAARDLPIALSRDWHPRKTNHFAEFGGPWPVHCVANTSGAEFHPGLRIPEIADVFSKGTREDEDAYSAFQGEMTVVSCKEREIKWPLATYLNRYDVDTLFIGGLATDYCVRAIVLEALNLGYKVYLLTDACRAVNINPEDGENAIREMTDAGAELMTTKEAIAYVTEG